MIARRLFSAMVAAMALSTLVAPAYAAASCTVAPTKPLVRATWTTSGGPSITVAAATGKSPATSVRWTVSYLNPDALRWSNYTPWKALAVTSKQKTMLRPALAANRSLINVIVIATNRCGSSGQQRLMVPLKSARELVAVPTLARAIPLRVKKISYDELAGATTSGLPLSVTTSTPEVCGADANARQLRLIAAGECRVRISERNSSISLPNADVERAIDVVADLAPLPAVAVDRADDRTGFQIHVVYVTPRGEPSHDYAAGGQLELWVDLAQRWIKEQIGRTFAFDTSNGRLDVTSLASGMSLDEMRARTGGETAGTGELLTALAAEFAKSNGAAVPGKNLLFVLDGKLSDGYCGFADRPGTFAIVTAASPGCWTGDHAFIAQLHGLNWMSATIIHELLHNVGVPHTCADATDIMIGEGCANPDASGVLTLDASGAHYLGSGGAALDIRAVKVWSDGSGSRHIAADGLCYVEQPCVLEQTWWNSGDQTLALQQLVQGSWQTVARFTSRRDAVTSPKYPYTYDVTLTPTATGSNTYRYRLEPSAGWSEYIGDVFTVVVPY